MTAITLPRPFAISQLTWLIVLGFLTLAAVEAVRVDPQAKDVYLTDGYGRAITDGFGQGITIAREHQWDLVIWGPECR